MNSPTHSICKNNQWQLFKIAAAWGSATLEIRDKKNLKRKIEKFDVHMGAFESSDEFLESRRSCAYVSLCTSPMKVLETYWFMAFKKTSAESSACH